MNQKVALALLATMGHRADVVANGSQVIEAMRRQRYDVVLMDVEMPEMDGMEATRRIRAEWPDHERPRIVAMTAKAMQDDREMCLAAGMDEYLAKPIRADELAEVLGRLTADRPVGTPPPLDDAARAVLDLSVAEQLAASMGNPGFTSELIAIFVRDAPNLLTALREGLERGNVEEIRRAAHTLKTNARTIGAMRLSEACGDLEAAATAEALGSAAELLRKAEEEHAKVETRLAAPKREAVT